ncbi:MAG: adenylosuccinate synthase [Chitinophagaceae bacterium]|nr:adenylosuccinate synthase [Chitinophagaceae bacterium]MEA3427436.1 adenylosuccinate synthase [Bacteroidota bacterium]MCA6451636.1 adenylosuccinate synthase [Chitinophagaceae bacterium]MCA6456289.1 adenylosuccinate synthase [Chitinophagaceae bacterium]MCA6460237.1 adenylosuccinate synthase [Chitinophagaceae bacterium]
MVDVILGLQWGDEGKGKIVDYFAPQYDIIARFQGGPNAGHTLYVEGKKMVLHQIPSGIFHQNKVNVIGNGVVLDPITLKKECEAVAAHGVDVRKNLFISERTNIIIPTHRALDKASELSKGEGKIGSTLKGIGPAYMDKTGRNALRVGDILNPNFKEQYNELRAKHQVLLNNFHFTEDISSWEEEFFEALEFLKTLNVINCEYFINDQISKGKKVLAEGAQGSMLDIDFGTFPFVTSSNTISAGVCTGLGVSPKQINEVMGVTKAYCTRVGGGPFPTELEDATGEELRKIGNEFGATTGRPRRCGWIDLVALRYACMINGVTQVIMTKADVLDAFAELQVCTAYSINGKQTKEVPFQMSKVTIEPVLRSFEGWNTDTTQIKEAAALPGTMGNYINFINSEIGAPVKYVSNGPGRDQIVPL